MKRIHIVGAPRTGTTLMLELMVTGFEIDGYASEETSVLTYPQREFRVLLTKNPRDHAAVVPLLALDPEQWFIFMLRDPRDMLVSRHGRAPDRYWSGLNPWRAAWRNIADVRQHSRLKVVRYEDLVAAPDVVQTQIAEFLPFLRTRARFSEFHRHSRPSRQSAEAMGPLRPIDGDSVGAWRRHKPRVVAQIQRHGPISQDLIDAGYERDDAWLQELEGVEPDRSPGFWPELEMEEYVRRLRQAFEAELPGYLVKRGLRLR